MDSRSPGKGLARDDYGADGKRWRGIGWLREISFGVVAVEPSPAAETATSPASGRGYSGGFFTYMPETFGFLLRNSGFRPSWFAMEMATASTSSRTSSFE